MRLRLFDLISRTNIEFNKGIIYEFGKLKIVFGKLSDDEAEDNFLHYLINCF